MSHIERVDIADPRNISLILLKDDLTGNAEKVKRITHFYPRVLDLSKLDHARKGVFETSELLEQILSFLPMKNIFGVRRVSKYWNDVVASSIQLQEKMFLRVRDEPREFWIAEVKDRIGANNYRVVFDFVNNKQFKLRRIDRPEDSRQRLGTMVTMNPMLQPGCTELSCATRMYIWGGRELANYIGWVDAFQHGGSSLWNTYLTDPPCHKATVDYFVLYFGRAPSAGDDAEDERWKPANDTVEAVYPPKGHPVNSQPIRAELKIWRGMDLQSDVGLTMADVLKAAFKGRGGASCRFGNWVKWKHDDATMHDAIKAVKRRLGRESILKSTGMQLEMRLEETDSARVLVPTERERAYMYEYG